MRGDTTNIPENLIEVTNRFDMVGETDPDSSSILAGLLIDLHVLGACVTLADGGNADGVVIIEEVAQPLSLLGERRRTGSGSYFHITGAISKDARRLPTRILFRKTGTTVGNFERSIDAAELQSERVQ